MKVIIFGGTGYIGQHLTSYFKKKGDDIVLVTRSKRPSLDSFVRYVTWSELQENLSSLEEADSFINLVGETINQYWTPKAKEKILESRIGTTKKVAEFIQRLKVKPNVVINGSAVGIYGISETTEFDERSLLSNNDFLARVVNEWENATDTIESYTRLVKLRIGVVLGRDGGALPKMILPYKFFVGGRIGSGRQWLSWIHVDDLVSLINFCIGCEKVKGPINATAPTPVTNNEFGHVIAKELNRPHIFPVPALILQILFGEMSQLLLNGQKVLPRKAMDLGFSFSFPTIEGAVSNLLKGERTKE